MHSHARASPAYDPPLGYESRRHGYAPAPASPAPPPRAAFFQNLSAASLLLLRERAARSSAPAGETSVAQPCLGLRASIDLRERGGEPAPLLVPGAALVLVTCCGSMVLTLAPAPTPVPVVVEERVSSPLRVDACEPA